MTADTKAKLIAAGERLFGDRGIHAVSLREINLAAGQRNTSALHYHFGGRDGLVRAIIDKHVPPLAARRAALIGELEADGAHDDTRRLLAVIVQPLGEFLAGTDSQRAFLKVMDQLFGDPGVSLEQIEEIADDPANRYVFEALHQRGDGIPRPLMSERLLVATSQVVNAFANRARYEEAAVRARRLLPLNVFIHDTLDMMHAAVFAPVSPQTLHQLDSTKEDAP